MNLLFNDTASLERVCDLMQLLKLVKERQQELVGFADGVVPVIVEDKRAWRELEELLDRGSSLANQIARRCE